MSVATTRTNSVTTVYGREVSPKVGMAIEGDGWRFGYTLLDCEQKEPVPGFSGADFRIESMTTGESRAVNVAITGRVPTTRLGSHWLRCKITFVGDCEPDTVVKGWIKLG